jgi:hypothetical protein
MTVTENPIFAMWVSEHDPGALRDLYGADLLPASDPRAEHVTHLDKWLAGGGDVPWCLDGWARSDTGLAARNYQTALALHAPKSVVQRRAATLVSRCLDNSILLGD